MKVLTKQQILELIENYNRSIVDVANSIDVNVPTLRTYFKQGVRENKYYNRDITSYFLQLNNELTLALANEVNA